MRSQSREEELGRRPSGDSAEVAEAEAEAEAEAAEVEVEAEAEAEERGLPARPFERSHSRASASRSAPSWRSSPTGRASSQCRTQPTHVAAGGGGGGAAGGGEGGDGSR